MSDSDGVQFKERIEPVREFISLRALSSFVAMLFLLLLPATVQAEDYTYAIDAGTITITGYTGPGGAVTIPSAIGGLPVTGIGEGAFAWTALTSLTLPASVTNIGSEAFIGCFSLSAIAVAALNPAYRSVAGVLFNKSLTTLIQCPGGKAGGYSIPSGVTSIGSYAFYYCDRLTTVTIPNSVNNIGGGAFSSCTSLYSVSIPNGVTNIGDYAFSECIKLTSVTIGNGVTSIGSYAFYYCPSLTRVTLGSSVISIGDWAFDNCANLTSVSIPDSVTSIGDEAFSGCTSLTNVTIGDSVTSIGDGVFGECTNLTSVTIPSSVILIGGYAFVGCANVTNVTLGNSVTSIGDGAFGSCANLTSATIPSSVTNIGGGMFQYCPSLTAITVDAFNSAYSSVDGVLFNKSQTTLIQCPARKAGGYTIPNGVTSIGDWAFGECINLTSVSIPDSVTNIGNWAFYGSTNLTTIPSRVTSIGDWAFGECNNLTNVSILSVTNIGNWAFSGCTSLTNLTIGNKLTSIGQGAFYGCTNLTIVTIGNNVTDIFGFAFYGCSSLTGVFFEGNASRLHQGYLEYEDRPGGGWIWVPTPVFGGVNGTVYFLPGTTGWERTFGDLPTALWVLPHPLILNNGPSFGVQTSGFGFIISWATNVPVMVEASADLANPLWIPVSTNTLTGGASYFSDPEWTNHPARFYRLRSP